VNRPIYNDIFKEEVDTSFSHDLHTNAGRFNSGAEGQVAAENTITPLLYLFTILSQMRGTIATESQ
jgi:hypothetical protein